MFIFSIILRRLNSYPSNPSNYPLTATVALIAIKSFPENK